MHALQKDLHSHPMGNKTERGWKGDGSLQGLEFNTRQKQVTPFDLPLPGQIWPHHHLACFLYIGLHTTTPVPNKACIMWLFVNRKACIGCCIFIGGNLFNFMREIPQSIKYTTENSNKLMSEGRGENDGIRETEKSPMHIHWVLMCILT